MKYHSPARALSIVCALAAAFTTLACSATDVVAKDPRSVSLSFTASARTASGMAASTQASSPALGPVPTVTKVQLVLTKLALARSEDANCVNEGEHEDEADDEGVAASSTVATLSTECEHVSRDPLLIDMPVDGSLHTQLNVPLAEGSYRKLEAKLGVVSDRTAANAAFLAEHPEFAGSSIKVEGAYNGLPFVFRLALKASIEMEFNPALVIDGSTKNATIAVDVSRWFVTVNGDVIDPSRATPGTPAAAIITHNIRASFRAFEDNNRSGRD